MASAGVLKFQAPRPQESSDRSRAKEVIPRQRRTLSCIQCKALKVSCDRRLPCSRCKWRGKEDACSYVPYPSARNSPDQQGERAATNCVFYEERATWTAHTICPVSSFFNGDTSAGVDLSLWWEFPTVVNRHLFPQLALDWRLARSLNGLYKQLSCVLEFLDNPLTAPVLVQRGRTHWQAVLDQCAANLPDLINGSNPSPDLESSGPPPCTFSVMRMPSFPFEVDPDDRPLSKSQIISWYLPSKEVTAALVGAYFDTIEAINRLFHVPTLELELERYWSSPSSASYDWLAQLLAILSLGTRVTQEGIGGRVAASSLPYSVERYLRGVSRCLAHLSYPFHATLETVRTLCLMATAKKASLFSCHERDACGPLLDAALYMCLSLGLDQVVDDARRAQRNWLDMVMENRVWTTVRYMYLHHSLHTGTPVLLQPSIMRSTVPENVNDRELGSASAPKDSIRDVSEWTDSSAELLLSKSLPLAFEIVSLANSSTAAKPGGVDFIAGDALVRELLRETDEIFSETDGSTWKCLQRCMLIIYFRRLLLTIYHMDSQQETPKSAIGAGAAAKFSPLAAMECAIAILVQQRSMLENPGRGGAPGRVVAELFKEDFFIAALVVGSEWIRTTSFLSSLSRLDHAAGGVLSPRDRPAGETVLQGLHWCRTLWARDVEHSICNFAAYSMLGRLLDVIGSG